MRVCVCGGGGGLVLGLGLKKRCTQVKINILSQALIKACRYYGDIASLLRAALSSVNTSVSNQDLEH